MSSVVGLALILLLVLGAAAIGAVVWSVLPVSYERAEKFVERTGVTLTATNAAYVVDAIARTRRYRAAAVLLTLAVAIAWGIVSGVVSFTTVTGVGLASAVLVGTVVGELRNASVRADGPRSATLSARQESQYVGSWARTAPSFLAALSVVLLVAALVVAPGFALGAAVAALVALSAWGISRWATGFVVERPRPATTDSNVLAADDGLRSRALHAIGGAASLVAGWAVVLLGALLFVGPRGEQTNTPLALLAWILMIGVAAAAWAAGSKEFLVASSVQAEAVADAVEHDGGAAR